MLCTMCITYFILYYLILCIVCYIFYIIPLQATQVWFSLLSPCVNHFFQNFAFFSTSPTPLLDVTTTFSMCDLLFFVHPLSFDVCPLFWWFHPFVSFSHFPFWISNFHLRNSQTFMPIQTLSILVGSPAHAYLIHSRGNSHSWHHHKPHFKNWLHPPHSPKHSLF